MSYYVKGLVWEYRLICLWLYHRTLWSIHKIGRCILTLWTSIPWALLPTDIQLANRLLHVRGHGLWFLWRYEDHACDVTTQIHVACVESWHCVYVKCYFLRYPYLRIMRLYVLSYFVSSYNLLIQRKQHVL